MISLDPLLRKLLDTSRKLAFRCCLEETDRLDGLVLLARPLKAANPDALHPGKARE